MPAVGRTPTDRGYLSIKEVLDVLVEEFPDVTISKIRFLESRGLIHPERTPSGYRKFFDIDVDRLRWILRQQRENFLPLKVIKGRLDGVQGGTVEASLFDSELDDDDSEAPFRSAPSPVLSDRPSVGVHASAPETPLIAAPALPRILPSEPVAPRVEDAAPQTRTSLDRAEGANRSLPDRAPVVVDESSSTDVADGVVAVDPPKEPVPTKRSDRPRPRGGSVALSAGELCGASGAAPGLISALEDFGLISATVVDGVRSYDDDALVVARLASTFAEFGVEPRHLVMLKRAADRQGELYSQAVGPLMRQRNPAARQQAQERLDRLVEVGSALQAEFVKVSLQRNIRS